MRRKLIICSIFCSLLLVNCSYLSGNKSNYNKDNVIADTTNNSNNELPFLDESISDVVTMDESVIDNYKFVIDTNEMMQNLTTLCESPRRFGTEGEEKASNFLNQKLISYGYETGFQEFNVYSRNILDAIHASSISEYFQVDKDKLLGEGKNIVTLSGNKGKKDLYLVAHYDTTKNSLGAVDNGSGVIVVLEVAKQLQNLDLPFNLRVVLFSAEEFALQGSTYYVSQLSQKEKSNAIGCINIDLVGQIGEPEIILKTIMNQINILSVLMDGYHNFNNESGSASDHRSFYMGGIPVISFGDDINHNKEDISPMDNIDINKLKELAQVLCEFIVNLDLKEYNELLESSYSENYTINPKQTELLGYTLTEAKEFLKEDGSGSKQQFKLSNTNGTNVVITEEDSRFLNPLKIYEIDAYSLYEEQVKYKIKQDNSDGIVIYYKDLFTSNNYGELKGIIDLYTALELIKNRTDLINEETIVK